MRAQTKSAKTKRKSPRKPDAPPDTVAIRKCIRDFLSSEKFEEKSLGSWQWGIYAFFDFDGEPIYVGQTREGISARIGRHLTGQRSDAVAKNVLDPFEVESIRVWPLDLRHLAEKGLTKKGNESYKMTPKLVSYLDSAERAVYDDLIAASTFKAILNEKPPAKGESVKLNKPFIRSIIPDELRAHRQHPDVRIARRAGTIAALARVISEREIDVGLRNVLLLQCSRLERLAESRLAGFGLPKSEGYSEKDGEKYTKR
jgi:hypothetical protein